MADTPAPPADPNAAVYGGAVPVPTTPVGGASLPGAGAVPTASQPDTSTFAGLNPSLNGVTYQETIHGSPAVPKGANKGKHDGDLTRISDLVKIISTISSGNRDAMTHLNVDALSDVYHQAAIPQMDAASDINLGADGPLWQHSDSDQLGIVQVAYHDLVKHLARVGIPQGPGQNKNPANMADALHEVKQLGNVPLDATTLDRLSRQGFDTSKITNVRDLVAQHDSLAAGAPGSPGIAASPGAPGPVPASQVYRDFQKGMGDAAQRTKYVDLLSATGYLDTTATAPTDQQVSEAYQNLMLDASKAGMSPDVLLSSKVAASGATESVDLAYVNHVASQIGVSLSPTTAQAIANQIGAAGTTGAYTDDRVWAEVGSHYDYNQQGGPGGQSGFAAFAEQNIREAYSNMGVSLSNDQVAKLTKQVITGQDPKTGQSNGGPTSIYQVGDTATSTATEVARQQAIQMYAPLAQQIQQGASVKTLADPYLQTAANTLGIGVNDINITDPKWMAWATEGQGGAAMTPAQWASHLMTDPQYGYVSSQPAKAQAASGAAGLLQLFGKMPGEQPFSAAASTSGVANQ